MEASCHRGYMLQNEDCRGLAMMILNEKLLVIWGKKRKKSIALGVPKWSPTLVLSQPNAA
jgi:hypothetical protein